MKLICNHTISCIKKVPIFLNLTETEMKEIIDISVTRKLKKGELIHGAGDDGGKLFVLSKGNVKLYRLNINGRKQVLRTINPGEFFGELSLFSSVPLSNFAEALNDVELCILDGDKLKHVMSKHTTIAFKVMDTLSRRLEQVENQLESISQDSVETRIITELLNLSSINNEITLKMTRSDLASKLGMSQESLSRSLNNMQDDGLITLKGHKKIIINNKDKLIEIINSLQ